MVAPVAGKYTRSGFETRTVSLPTWTSVAGVFATKSTVPAAGSGQPFVVVLTYRVAVVRRRVMGHVCRA